jgi:hypothetical protein
MEWIGRKQKQELYLNLLGRWCEKELLAGIRICLEQQTQNEKILKKKRKTKGGGALL